MSCTPLWSLKIEKGKKWMEETSQINYLVFACIFSQPQLIHCECIKLYTYLIVVVVLRSCQVNFSHSVSLTTVENDGLKTLTHSYWHWRGCLLEKKLLHVLLLLFQALLIAPRCTIFSGRLLGINRVSLWEHGSHMLMNFSSEFHHIPYDDITSVLYNFWYFSREII